MYAKLEEITLIHPSKYRKLAGREDRPIYERGLNMDRVFTFDSEPTKYDSAAPQRYGVAYIGPNEDVCIVPDLWVENDSWLARRAVRPDWLVFTVKGSVGELVISSKAVFVKASEGQRFAWHEAIEVNGQMYAADDRYEIIAGPVAKIDDLPTAASLREGFYQFHARDLDGRWYLVVDPGWQNEPESAAAPDIRDADGKLDIAKVIAQFNGPAA